MRHVLLRPSNRIIHHEAPPQPAQTLLRPAQPVPAALSDIGKAECQEIVDIALGYGQRAIHICLAQGEIRVERKPTQGFPVLDSDSNLWIASAKIQSTAIGQPQSQGSIADDLRHRGFQHRFGKPRAESN